MGDGVPEAKSCLETVQDAVAGRRHACAVGSRCSPVHTAGALPVTVWGVQGSVGQQSCVCQAAPVYSWYAAVPCAWWCSCDAYHESTCDSCRAALIWRWRSCCGWGAPTSCRSLWSTGSSRWALQDDSHCWLDNRIGRAGCVHIAVCTGICDVAGSQRCLPTATSTHVAGPAPSAGGRHARGRTAAD